MTDVVAPVNLEMCFRPTVELVSSTRRFVCAYLEPLISDNFDVSLEFNGKQIHAGPARHSFGTVLASFVAYARAQYSAYPLRAGTIVTTGSLCGLVPVSGPGHAVARFGNHEVILDLI